MDKQSRIAELKRRVQDTAAGAMISGGVENLDPDLQERFWAGVLAVENARRRPLSERLAEAGFRLPPAGELDDHDLHEALRGLIGRLAEWRYFLLHTDHLKDRELYTLLREKVLVRLELELPPEAGYSIALDVSLFDQGLPPGTMFLRYYADKKTRRTLARECRGGAVPARRAKPCDRDRRLPGPKSGPVIFRPPFVDDSEPAMVIHG